MNRAHARAALDGNRYKKTSVNWNTQTRYSRSDTTTRDAGERMPPRIARMLGIHRN